MELHLGKFVHSERGKIIMSILLGFGLASLFRTVCKGNNCVSFYAPPLDDFQDKIYETKEKCVKYKPVITKCSLKAKTISFE